jgi:hypothetical protein
MCPKNVVTSFQLALEIIAAINFTAEAGISQLV